MFSCLIANKTHPAKGVPVHCCEIEIGLAPKPIGYLNDSGCGLIELKWVSASPQCRSVQVGQTSERTCSHCHLRMGVSFSSALFVAREAKRLEKRVQHKGPISNSANATAKSNSHAAEAAIVIGQPLPEFGTCRHYPHSHRQVPKGFLQSLSIKVYEILA